MILRKNLVTLGYVLHGHYRATQQKTFISMGKHGVNITFSSSDFALTRILMPWDVLENSLDIKKYLVERADERNIKLYTVED